MVRGDFLIIADILIELQKRIPACGLPAIALFREQLLLRYPGFSREDFDAYIKSKTEQKGQDT